MYFTAQIFSSFPKEAASYIGAQPLNHLNFVRSILSYAMISFLTVLLCCIFERLIDSYLHPVKSNIVFKYSLADKNESLILILLSLYLVSCFIARLYGVEIVYHDEQLSGLNREIIFYLYRSIIPFTLCLLLISYRDMSNVIRAVCLLTIVTACIITLSRTPIFTLGIPLAYSYLQSRNRSTKFFSIFLSIFIVLILILFISTFRGLYFESDLKYDTYIEVSKFQKLEIVNTINQLFKIIKLNPYDIYSTTLSRICSHVDFLIIYDWKLNNVEVVYLIINRIFGITLSAYNFQNDMINLYGYIPGRGQMIAPNPPGIILAIFNSGYLGAFLIVFILAIILKLVNIVSKRIELIFKLDDFQLLIFNLVIVVNWFWISPRVSLVYLLIFYIFSNCILVERK